MNSTPIGGVSPSRRTFLGAAATAAALAAVGGLLPSRRAFAADKPNSNFNGVRIGAITYSYRGGKINTAEETLAALIQDGLSEVEMMPGPIQTYAGLGMKRIAQKPVQPEGDPAAQLKKVAEMRKMYNDAGVNIHIHKIPFGGSDEEIDFNFEVAKALGCVAITTERDDKLARKLAPFAEKHKIYVAFHNHTKNFPKLEEMDPLLDAGKYIMFNFDVGHYVGGTKGLSPIPVLEKYHERIVSLHLKDKTKDDKNVPWGQGDTPLKEILQLLKKEKWPIYGDIELEYAVPKDSDAVSEVAKCVRYCREALA
jgi:sugar phosphate isomerase/epimerase